MSSGLFHWDWYVDPPWDRVSLSWLQNYVNNIRGNPGLAQTLSSDSGRFEMVPMPREVLNNLASLGTQFDPIAASSTTPVAQPIADYVKDRVVARSANELITLVRAFAGALEAGNIDKAMTAISKGYMDRSARDAGALRADLDKMGKNLVNLKIVPFKAEDLHVVGNHIVATVHAAWQAHKQGPQNEQQHHAATSKIELIFEKDDSDTWKIGSLQML